MEPQCRQAEDVPDPLLEVPPGIPPYSATLVLDCPPTVVSIECLSNPDYQMPSDAQPSGILEAPKEVSITEKYHST